MSYKTPLRTPDQRDEPLMRRRAWWLVVLGLVLPGVPQLLTGRRRLGRIGLIAWLGGIAAVVAVWLWARADTAAAATVLLDPWALLGIEAVLVAWTALWLVLVVDMFRTARLGRVRVRSRVAISLVTVVALVAGVAGAAVGVMDLNAARSALGGVFGGSGRLEAVDGRYNFVLLGADAGAGREGMRPDSISVVSVDAKTGQAAIIGIPRDMHPVRLPTSSPLHGVYPKSWKANGGYTYASQVNRSVYSGIDDDTGFTQGIQAMKDIASGVTGLTVSYYVLIDMSGFAQMVDALGGIDIDVPEHLDFVDGSDEHHVYHGSVEAGWQHMDGETALWYARSRKTTSDWDRMKRQRQVQEALIQQFTPATLLTKFQAIAEASPEFVNTDIPRDSVGTLVALANRTRTQTINTLELTPPEFAESNLDWTEVDAAVEDVISRSKGEE